MAKPKKQEAAKAASTDTAPQGAAASAAVAVQGSDAAPVVDPVGEGVEKVATTAADPALSLADPAGDAITTTDQADASAQQDAGANGGAGLELDANADLDAQNTAAVIAQVPDAAAEILAAGGIDTAATFAATGEEGSVAYWLENAGEVDFPALVRVTNNTRMPVQIIVVPVALGASPSAEVAVAKSEGDFLSLLRDLDVIAQLNNFGPDAYSIEVLTEGYE